MGFLSYRFRPGGSQGGGPCCVSKVRRAEEASDHGTESRVLQGNGAKLQAGPSHRGSGPGGEGPVKVLLVGVAAGALFSLYSLCQGGH